MGTEHFKKSTANVTFLYGGSAPYIEAMQLRYLANPNSVDPEWQDFFGALDDDADIAKKASEGASWTPAAWAPPTLENSETLAALTGDWSLVEKKVTDKLKDKPVAAGTKPSEADFLKAARDSVRAFMMIRAYRMYGHFQANLDPLGIEKPMDHPELHPAHYGFTEADMDRNIFIDGFLGSEYATARQILDNLRKIYCSTIGYEFMHISDPVQREWLRNYIEQNKINFSKEGKLKILQELVKVKGYERYLDKKFVGAKRFGLDGGEATIPGIEQIIKRGAELGLKEVVLGMAHRGRLNVLSQVMGKPHRAIFSEFKGGSFLPDEVAGSGDVKYHLGASIDREAGDQIVHLSLTPNPSHLEIVDPVVLGKVRAKQDQSNDRYERISALPLLIHGDAAFAGQGVVAEILSMSGLKGYSTGGSVHFIINNQIGFTTDPECSRSTHYSSDLAKAIEAPIFHVNGDDPEAVVFVSNLAIEFRQRFHKPVVIDMYCFRLYGHNEGDEPSFTQPLMYKVIRTHKSTLEIYGERLVAEGITTQDDIEKANADWIAYLDSEYDAGETYRPNKADWLEGYWAGLKVPDHKAQNSYDTNTGVGLVKLKNIGEKLVAVPEGMNLHKTVDRFIDARKKIVETETGIDWATAESLAFGSFLDENVPVRLSGQDSERGTFTQRHSTLIDQENSARFTPLNYLRDGQAKIEIVNSMLSEEAVLAFEYGYTLAEPQTLVLWEAQFGDFANGAQVVFDQFLSSSERKWLRMSGLVCLLPHGYEGQGPEHSSARLERYLQLCAEDNWQVVNCSTPANYFHVLRRQIKRDFRKPLMIMTPKSLLRHKLCKSDFKDLAEGTTFHRILKDDAETKLTKDDKIRRVILCSGKVYYDLFEEREKRGIDDVYLLRVEQLYPFPADALEIALSCFKNADMVWCQEEPKNMGAWSFIEPLLEEVLIHIKAVKTRMRYVGRPASASTATGQSSQHLAQLAAYLEESFRA